MMDFKLKEMVELKALCVCGVGEEMGGGGDSGKMCGFCMMLLL